MSDLESYIDLVRKAQHGGKDATDRLAEVASLRLREYVLRLTLDKDLTEDIVQESILEMLRVFDKLKRAERFWSWLYGIAYNKVRTHRRGRSRHKTTLLSAAQGGISDEGKREVFAEMVGGELRQIVLIAMAELKPRQRDVLTMRCYDRMAYAEIAEVMGCSKFAAQALFYRAKKSLAKGLSRHGLGKGYLLAALVLFGKVTASSEAAANITVTAATLKIGTAASLAAIATSKTAIVTMTTAAIVTAGSLVVEPGVVESHDGQTNPDADSPLATQPQPAKNAGAEESWYFYPEGSPGPVMMRLTESNGRFEDSRFRILQNQHGNYRYDRGLIYIDNAHLYNADLSVMRLPADDKALSAFISQIEGRPADMEYVSAWGAGLLVICKRDNTSDKIWRVDRRSNVQDEVFFESHWPEGTRIFDNRDAMHQRGWTYFRITGQIGGEQVSGTGRIPFVYAAREQYWPWLRLQVGAKEFVDAGDGALFKGLSRPWAGLHTIDTVRRDAAEQDLWFETTYTPAKGKAEIVLTCDKEKLIYTVDMEKDVIDRITFSFTNGTAGELRFSYLQKIDRVEPEFVEPRTRTGRNLLQQPGMLWLVQLCEIAGHQ